MSAARKTSKQALPNVPGAAMVQALGDAVFGAGNAVVEQTYPVTFQGRPVTVNLSVEEVVRYLTATGWTENERLSRDVARMFVNGGHALWAPREVPSTLWPPHNRTRQHRHDLHTTVTCIGIAENRDPLDVVESILAARHGDAPPGDLDATAAAILRLFAVAPDTGIAEDEVTRHLLALDLTSDVDDVSDRLLAMVTATTLAIVRRGKPDTRKRGPIMYARGPAFPATGGAS